MQWLRAACQLCSENDLNKVLGSFYGGGKTRGPLDFSEDWPGALLNAGIRTRQGPGKRERALPPFATSRFLFRGAFGSLSLLRRQQSEKFLIADFAELVPLEQLHHAFVGFATGQFRQ